MKVLSMLTAAAASLPLINALPTDNISARAIVEGFDISSLQPAVNFPAAFGAGLRFVTIKATESVNLRDPKVSHFQP